MFQTDSKSKEKSLFNEKNGKKHILTILVYQKRVCSKIVFKLCSISQSTLIDI